MDTKRNTYLRTSHTARYTYGSYTHTSAKRWTTEMYQKKKWKQIFRKSFYTLYIKKCTPTHLLSFSFFLHFFWVRNEMNEHQPRGHHSKMTTLYSVSKLISKIIVQFNRITISSIEVYIPGIHTVMQNYHYKSKFSLQ